MAHPIVSRFVSAIRKRYPVSNRDIAFNERPDILQAFTDHSAEYSKLESKYGFVYPTIVRELHSYLPETFIYFDFLSYRQICLPDEVELGMSSFIEFKEDFGDEFDYWCDKKIPIFSSDGQYDIIDLSNDLDDPPVIHYDPYEPDQHRVLFPSVSRYLELLAIELESGDVFDWDSESSEDYVERMRSRSTEDLLVIE